VLRDFEEIDKLTVREEDLKDYYLKDGSISLGVSFLIKAAP